VIDVMAIGHLVQSVAELSILVADSAKNLAGYVSLADVVLVATDLQVLSSQLSVVGGRMTGRSAWWLQAGIPQTSVDLSVFRLTANGQCYVTMQDGYGLQTLMTHLASVLATVARLLSNVGAISGSVGGLQTLQGHLGSLNYVFSSLTGMMAGMNEASLCHALQERTERMGAEYMGLELLQDWGAYTPPY